MKIDFERINKIHFIGIGGIGLSAIAKFMKLKGKQVGGSDLNRSLIVDKLREEGIKIFIGQDEKNISQDVDLVIHTMAISENNPELKRAKELNIQTITYPEALGILFNDKFGVAVCGTHGKSSTTAMAGLMLDDAEFDPSIVIGSILPRYRSNLRIGKGKYFLIEACEYERAFLNYYPKIIILNNIELDHTDYYKNLEDFKSAFSEFLTHLPDNGILICNGDDEMVSNIRQQVSSVVRFGLGENNDARAEDIKFEDGQVSFQVIYKKENLGKFVLKVPGLFNVYNALGAISLGLTLKISIEKIKKSLKDYSGIWRRFEIKGEYKKALVISDYAHHPTAVKSVIEATKNFYPGKRVFAVFQPHQHNRTKELYQDFLKSFDKADIMILSEIFDVVGREEKKDQTVSSCNLVNDIKKQNKNISENIFYAKDLTETRKLIDENIKPDDILLIIGAGDIYKIADDLVE
ncbi:MAG: UDP-N-acetylmuramate--L-alanine ligase [Candidatus Pacebacteria bacterium]|nr:UDP-N-acetylmuramate--L-alanine ligase [Candidatus Paceibacterota bacterium]